MSVIDDLIYDRTQADVDRVFTLKNKILAGGLSSLSAEEKSEYMAGMKGAYNVSDLNRVGTAVEYIAQQFADQGYVVSVNPKKDWVVNAVPNVSQLEEYLQNIDTLRGVITVAESTPETPANMALLNYVKANDIEQILFDVSTLLTNVEKQLYFSGEIFSNEV